MNKLYYITLNLPCSCVFVRELPVNARMYAFTCGELTGLFASGYLQT